MLDRVEQLRRIKLQLIVEKTKVENDLNKKYKMKDELLEKIDQLDNKRVDSLLEFEPVEEKKRKPSK